MRHISHSFCEQDARMLRHLLARGYVDPNFPNPMGPGDTSIIIYGYTPALSLAVVGAASFGICAVALIALLIRVR